MKPQQRTGRYKVSAGEKTSTIASFLGCAVEDLVAANPHKELTRLVSGETVFAALAEGEELAHPFEGEPMAKGTIGTVSGPGAVPDYRTLESYAPGTTPYAVGRWNADVSPRYICLYQTPQQATVPATYPSFDSLQFCTKDPNCYWTWQPTTQGNVWGFVNLTQGEGITIVAGPWANTIVTNNVSQPCPPGTTRVNGKCQKTSAPWVNPCPPGSQMVGGKCQKITGSAPGGYGKFPGSSPAGTNGARFVSGPPNYGKIDPGAGRQDPGGQGSCPPGEVALTNSAGQTVCATHRSVVQWYGVYGGSFPQVHGLAVTSHAEEGLARGGLRSRAAHDIAAGLRHQRARALVRDRLADGDVAGLRAVDVLGRLADDEDVPASRAVQRRTNRQATA